LHQPDGRSEMSTFFCVGTMKYAGGDTEPSSGRLLVFDGPEMSTGSGPWLTAFTHTPGCVYALASVKGQIAAAVNSSVIIYALQSSPVPSSQTASEQILTGVLRLEKVAEWNHNYLVTTLVARDDLIFVGDAFSSISIIKWSGAAFQTVARNYGPLWPTSLEVTGPSNTILAANDDFNLLLFQVSTEERSLSNTGSYHLGEQVNVFVPGRITTSSADAVVDGQMIFCTSSGRVGVISECKEEFRIPLTALQRNIESVLNTVGPRHEEWRAPHTSNGVSDAQPTAVNFLDGDLIEKFLDVKKNSADYKRIMEGTNEYERLELSHSDLLSILEQLHALH